MGKNGSSKMGIPAPLGLVIMALGIVLIHYGLDKLSSPSLPSVINPVSGNALYPYGYGKGFQEQGNLNQELGIPPGPMSVPPSADFTNPNPNMG